MIRLSSNAARNKWIDGKRAKVALEGSEVDLALTGYRIDVNERLSAPTRITFNEARRAVREKLYRAWVRDGIIFVKHQPSSAPVRVRDREHLMEVLSGVLRSTAGTPSCSSQMNNRPSLAGTSPGVTVSGAEALHRSGRPRTLPSIAGSTDRHAVVVSGARGINSGVASGRLPFSRD